MTVTMLLWSVVVLLLLLLLSRDVILRCLTRRRWILRGRSLAWSVIRRPRFLLRCVLRSRCWIWGSFLGWRHLATNAQSRRMCEPGCEYCSGAPLSINRDCRHTSISAVLLQSTLLSTEDWVQLTVSQSWNASESSLQLSVDDV